MSEAHAEYHKGMNATIGIVGSPEVLQRPQTRKGPHGTLRRARGLSMVCAWMPRSIQTGDTVHTPR
jgi:hypothetical protein